MTADYCEGATIDRQLDDADRGKKTIACPVRVLWARADEVAEEFLEFFG